jgi:hypothetical protein
MKVTIMLSVLFASLKGFRSIVWFRDTRSALIGV